LPELRCQIDERVWRALTRRAERSGAPVEELVDLALRELLGVGRPTLFQVSTAGALVEGLYQGAVAVGTLREHGDLGLGTFEDLDGEMVVVDGRVHQVRSDGTVALVPDDVRSPFAMVTRLGDVPEQRLPLVESMAELTAELDALRSTGNLFFAIRIDGHCDRLHVRAACRTAPGVPLVEATAHQTELELRDVAATVVGFWSPPFTSGLDVAGYHLHALTDDRSAGGHVLDLRGSDLRLRLQVEGAVHVVLPDHAAFLAADLSRDPTADLDRAEH
jgi:acetolactate decarboxylase